MCQSARPADRWAWILPALALVCAAPASAQYVFLDSNGDGARTSDDLLRPLGTTTISIWLVMDRDRDGKKVTRKVVGSTVGSGRYTIVLRAINGDIAWGPYKPNPDANLNTPGIEVPDSNYLVVVGNLPNQWPPVKLCLGTVSVTVKHGTPAIELAYPCPVHSWEITSISAACWVGGFGRNLVGLQYAGRANRPPGLLPLGNAPIRAGSKARLRIDAFDGDGDPLTFRLYRGPIYASVTTPNPGKGTAQGDLVLAPDSCTSSQTTECIVAVSDGTTSAFDTMNVIVQAVGHPTPPWPMQAAITPPPRPLSQGRARVNSALLEGEWEWWKHDASWVGPVPLDHRRRLIIHRNGTYQQFEIAGNRIQRVIDGTYTIGQEPEGSSLTLSRSSLPPDCTYGATLVGTSALELYYCWHGTDGSVDTYFRVPSAPSAGAGIDTTKIIDPIGPIRIRSTKDGESVELPRLMAEALKRLNPKFHVWGSADDRGSAITPQEGAMRGPYAILGDFDGDLLQDIALLGRSGADQVVVAVLSNHGVPGAVEVAWRRVRPGVGEGRSRGDPDSLRPIYLELAARGEPNRLCLAPPVDAVGIVETGVARFDYLFNGVGFAPFTQPATQRLFMK